MGSYKIELSLNIITHIYKYKQFTLFQIHVNTNFEDKKLLGAVNSQCNSVYTSLDTTWRHSEIHPIYSREEI